MVKTFSVLVGNLRLSFFLVCAILCPICTIAQIRLSDSDLIESLTRDLNDILIKESKLLPNSIRHIYYARYFGDREDFLNADSLIKNSYIETDNKKNYFFGKIIYPKTMGIFLNQTETIIGVSGINLEIYRYSSKIDEANLKFLNEADILNSKISVCYLSLNLIYYFIITEDNKVYKARLTDDEFKIESLEMMTDREFNEFWGRL